LIPFAQFAHLEQGEKLLKYGLAEKREDGIYVRGAEELFAWLCSQVENGKKGGRPKSNDLTKPTANPNEPKLTHSNHPNPNPNPTLKDLEIYCPVGEPTQTPPTQLVTGTESNTVKTKDRKQRQASIEATNILEMFNNLTGRCFRPTASKNFRHIQARLSEGFVFEDFEQVAKDKHRDWVHDPKMSQYLRPETVFGEKFDGYLQSAKAKLIPDTRPTFDPCGYDPALALIVFEQDIRAMGLDPQDLVIVGKK